MPRGDEQFDTKPVNATAEAVWEAYKMERQGKADHEEKDFLGDCGTGFFDLVTDDAEPDVAAMLAVIRQTRKDYKDWVYKRGTELKIDAEDGEPTLAFLLKL